MADEVDEVAYAEAILDALPEDATASDTFRAWHGNNPEITSAIAARRALAGAGGGGFSPARNVGQASFAFGEDVNHGVPTNLTLALDSGDAALVDLTDPTYPKIVTPGVYAFTLALTATHNATGGQGWYGGLLVDDNWYSLHVRDSRLSGEDDGFNFMPVCIVWWCDADDPFAVGVELLAVADSDHFAGTLYVQRIT